MGRLKSGLLLVILGLSAVPVPGQQSTSRDAHVGSVALVGDVERCDNYPVPGDHELTVRQAVLNAGLVAEHVNVNVIRSGQDRSQFTQVISANAADTGELVESGDILVVQAMSPIAVPVRKNAVLRTDSGVIFVGLEEEGIKIGDVLVATQTPPPADGELKVICRFQGQPSVTKAEMYTGTSHGDVISISHDNRRVIKGFGKMVPSVSEWKGRSVSRNRTSVPADSVEFAVDSSVLESNTELQPFELPLAPTGSMFLQIPKEESSEFSEVGPQDDRTDTPGVLPISQSDDIADLESDSSTESKISFASESATVAPAAPQEIKLGVVTGPKANAFNPWNLVFVGGLLLAGTLILAGTLRPDPEDSGNDIERAARQSISNSKRFTAIAPVQQKRAGAKPTQVDVASQPQSIAVSDGPGVSEPLSNEENVSDEGAESRSFEDQNALVAGHEWFSNDWNDLSRSGDQPPVNGFQDEQSKAESLVPVSSDFEATEPEVQREKTDIASEAESLVKPVVSECAADEIDVVSDNGIHHFSEANAVSTPIDDTAADKILDDTDTELLDLEDLLQNRLPIDLCEAQLPLRIALFGKPAGPRRLRIDAAHKTVPPPHMAMAVDKRRGQHVAANAVAVPTSSEKEGSGGLDRALHFLQERTES